MPRQPVLRHPWRIAVVVLALLAVLNLGILLAANSDTSEPRDEALPSSVESVRPGPGATASLVTDVQADLDPGLTGVLIIDGLCVPEDQIDVDPSLGTVAFRPGEDKDIERFEPGEHTVVVVYRDATLPAPTEPCDESQAGFSAYRWSFRATS